MKVELRRYTPDALNLLLETKGTRLRHNDDPATWSAEKKADHLAYMRDTIKSSWEFVDYVFRITEVSRAFTHQAVRTRVNSFAQEAMRVIDATGFEALTPPSVEANAMALEEWFSLMNRIDLTYQKLIALGIPTQDARGVLPTNVLTSIYVKANLRSLANTGELRLCTRTQGEYQDVFREMKRQVVEVHPWADEFIQVFCVNHTHCAFPRYGEKECPVYIAVQPNERVAMYRVAIREKWESVRFEARPVAKDGRAM